MAGMRIRLRRTTNIALIDGLFLGEGIIDLADFAFGYEAGMSLPVWLPELDDTTNRAILKTSQSLSGKSSNNTKNMELVWTTPNLLSVRNVDTNETYASFGNTAQTFQQAPDDFINNGAAQSLENFELNIAEGDPNVIKSYNTSSSGETMLGNLYTWIANPTPTFTADFARTYVPPVDMVDFVRGLGNASLGSHLHPTFRGPGLFKNTTERYPQGLGLRSWVWFPNASKMELTFYALIYMTPNGGRFNTRVGYPGNFKVYDTVRDVAPLYKAQVFHYDPAFTDPANHGKPLAIDWFYNVWWDMTSDGLLVDRALTVCTMAVFPGKLQVEDITPAMLVESQQTTHNLTYTSGVRTVTTYGNRIVHENFARPLLSDNYYLLTFAEDYPTEIIAKTPWGFSYRASTAPANGKWGFRYRASHIGDVSDVS